MARRDPHTKDLFAWEPDPVAAAYPEKVAGQGSLDSQISHVVAQALRDAKEAGVARSEVASRMAKFLGRPLHHEELNKWASEATTGRRIPLDAFIALAKATNSLELVGFVAGLFDMAAVHARFVHVIEFHQLQEHQQEVEARLSVLKAKTRARS